MKNFSELKSEKLEYLVQMCKEGRTYEPSVYEIRIFLMRKGWGVRDAQAYRYKKEVQKRLDADRVLDDDDILSEHTRFF